MISNLKQKLKAISTASPLHKEGETPRKAIPMERGDLGGEIIENDYGFHVVKRSIYPLDREYGKIPISSLMALTPLELSGWAKVQPNFVLSDLVFLDTETTGLGRGTGTVAFLVGLGRIQGDGLVIEQFVMRDYDEENSMLHGVMDALKGTRILVTFNGKSFDWPLLENRLVFGRLPSIDWTGAHIDLLHIARRLWQKRLDSCSLTSLERHILDNFREDDVPGSEIPGIYMDYLEHRQPASFLKVMRHNEWDIVAMGVLMAKVGSIYKEPCRIADAYELFGIGKHYEQEKRYDEATACYRTCIGKAEGGVPGPEAQKRLAYLLKRKQPQEAYLIWEELAEREGNRKVFPYIEMAKVLEHKEKDFLKALAYTNEALVLATAEAGVLGDNLLQEIRQRKQRLLKRLERIERQWGS